MIACPAVLSGDSFLSSLLLHIDCRGRSLGAVGYQVLAAPGSPIMVALTSALVLYVALYGIRLALGVNPTPVRGSLVAAAKVGVVLALATSWPAVQAVVFDVVTGGPDQVVGLITGRPGDAAATPTLVEGLQEADRALVRLTNLGTGRVEISALPMPGSDPSDPPQRFPIADNPAFGWARVLFLSGAVAAFAVTRLAAGALLALTPVFAGLMLFGASRGLFIGWARALAFTGVASIAFSLILTVELQLLQPWLDQTIVLRRAREITASVPIELLVLCLSFTAVLAGTAALLLRAAFMVHIPMRPLRELAGRLMLPAQRMAVPSAVTQQPANDHTPSRARVIADAVAATQRREAARRVSPSLSRPARGVVRPAAAGVAPPDANLVIPDFGPTSRRSRSRTSLGAQLRDRRS